MEIKVAIPVEIPPYWYQVDSPVILDKTITPQAKVVYAVISGLTRSSGECWASNEYISKLLGISKHTVSRCISELKDAGHILSIVQDNYRRTITLPYSRGSQKPQGGLPNLAKGLAKKRKGDSQKAQDNNKNELDELNNINKDTNTGIASQSAEEKKDDIEKQNTNTFLKNWAELYKSMCGQEYKIDYGKDNGIVKSLIDRFGYEQVLNKAKLLFKMCQNRAIWFTKGGIADFTIGKLSSQWNSILESNKGGNNGNSKFEQTLNAAREYAKEHGLV